MNSQTAVYNVFMQFSIRPVPIKSLHSRVYAEYGIDKGDVYMRDGLELLIRNGKLKLVDNNTAVLPQPSFM